MPEDATSLRRERLLSLAFALYATLTLARFVHEAWFRLLGSAPLAPASTRVLPHAPEAYRIALPALLDLLARHVTHGNPSLPFALTDLLFGLPALYLLSRLSASHQPGPTSRRLALVLFFALAHFPLLWVVPWLRPETLPSTLFLAAAAALTLRLGRHPAAPAALILLALAQAFIRADVALTFGVALVLGGLTQPPASTPAPRLLILSGAGIVLTAAAVQLYLQCILLPGLHYDPAVPTFTLRLNLTPHNFATAALALLPILSALLTLRRPFPLLERLLLLASALYAVLWFTLAIVDEVRVFVPFLFGLAVVGARALAPWINPQTAERA